jgi:hypothetical protein
MNIWPIRPGRPDHSGLVDWYFGGDSSYEGTMFRPKCKNREVVAEMFRRGGAMLTGRRTYEIAGGWSGTHPVNAMPVVVLTYIPPADPPQGRPQLIFVTDGIESAIAKAKQFGPGQRRRYRRCERCSASLEGRIGRRIVFACRADFTRRRRTPLRAPWRCGHSSAENQFARGRGRKSPAIRGGFLGVTRCKAPGYRLEPDSTMTAR